MGNDGLTPIDSVGKAGELYPGRTILFEHFGNGRRFCDALTDWDFQSGSYNIDGNAEQIRKDFEVSSFDEFKKKFSPTLWLTKYGNSIDSLEFQYSEDEYTGGNEVALERQAFYQMVDKIYESKKASGQSDIEFKLDEMKEVMLPQKYAADFKNLRKRLLDKDKEIRDAESKHLPLGKIKQLSLEFEKLMAKFIKSCKGDPFMTFLPIVIEDANIRIKALTGGKKVNAGNAGTGTLRIPMKLEFDKNGSLKVVEARNTTPRLTGGQNAALPVGSESEGNNLLAAADGGNTLPAVIDGKARPAFEDIIKERIGKEKDLQELNGNEFLSKSLLTCLKDNPYNGMIEEEALKREIDIQREKLKKYNKIYESAQQSFINAAHRLIEKIMGVKAFFDNARTSKSDKIKTTLLVTNCTVDDFLSDDDRKKALENYLKSVNSTPNLRLWFAMIPGIDKGTLDFDDDGDDVTVEGYDSYFKNDYDDEQEKLSSEKPTGSQTKRLLQILAENKIITFFNIECCEETNFSGMSPDMVSKYKNYTDTIDENTSEYSVICYPNFKLLPEQYYDLGDGIKLKSAPVGIDACYVACGLVCGMQNPEYLKEKGYTNVSPELVSVRINYEEKNAQNKPLTTKMNRARLYNWSEDMTKAIGFYGFCFSSDQIAGVNNTYVYRARTLSRNRNGEKYKPLFSILTRVFVAQYMIRLGGMSGAGISPDTVSKFKAISNDWVKNYAEFDNCVFRDNEGIVMEDKHIKVIFNKEDEAEISLEVID